MHHLRMLSTAHISIKADKGMPFSISVSSSGISVKGKKKFENESNVNGKEIKEQEKV